jgi:uncharacterized protein YndB with AHSA1/START domain
VRVRRRRRVAAPLEQVWSIAADPYALSRWWPRTQRVEGVSERGWTSVLVTEGGRTVRADYRLEASEPPRLRCWALEVAGTPFERLFAAAQTELRLRGDGTVTEVSLVLRERPRGWARLGGLVLRRAARRTLEEALTGLAALVERAPSGAATPDEAPSDAAATNESPSGGRP